MAMKVSLVEGKSYFWDGNTLVGHTPEGNAAIRDAMRVAAWPFVEGLAGWAEGAPENGAIVNFAANDEAIAAVADVLQAFAPTV